jgi:hypothetical protein
LSETEDEHEHTCQNISTASEFNANFRSKLRKQSYLKTCACLGAYLYPASWHFTQGRQAELSARVSATAERLVLLPRTVALARGTAGPSWCPHRIGGSPQRWRPISSILIEALARRGGQLWTLPLCRWLVPCRRAPVTVREVRALPRHGGGDDGLPVQSLPEIDDLLLEPDDLLLQDCDFGQKLQRLVRKSSRLLVRLLLTSEIGRKTNKGTDLRRQERREARQSPERPRERPLQSSVDVLLVPQLLPQLVHLQAETENDGCPQRECNELTVKYLNTRQNESRYIYVLLQCNFPVLHALRRRICGRHLHGHQRRLRAGWPPLLLLHRL